MLYNTSLEHKKALLLKSPNSLKMHINQTHIKKKRGKLLFKASIPETSQPNSASPKFSPSIFSHRNPKNAKKNKKNHNFFFFSSNLSLLSSLFEEVRGEKGNFQLRCALVATLARRNMPQSSKFTSIFAATSISTF